MIRTDRLLLREWRDSDLAPFAALNADPEVMRHFPAPLDRAQSDALAARARAHLDEHGWGLWAVEAEGHGFIGFIGLVRQVFPAHFTPATEIGWRLSRTAWGHGFATEGARAALAYGFDTLGLDEIVSMTAVGNIRSRSVMERIGMTRDPADDFEHPRVPVGHPVRAHVLYRVGRQDHAPSS